MSIRPRAGFARALKAAGEKSRSPGMQPTQRSVIATVICLPWSIEEHELREGYKRDKRMLTGDLYLFVANGVTIWVATVVTTLEKDKKLD